MDVLEPTILVSGLQFPECPRWHAGRLWFTDGQAGKVLAAGPDGETEVIAAFPWHPAGLGFLPDGTVLVVDMHGRRLTRLHPGAADGCETVADLSGLERAASNDMVVDGQGRAYVGGTGYDFVTEPEQPTNISLVVDGAARLVASDLIFPNGMVITPDGRTLIAGETMAYRLTAFAIQPDGSLSDRRVFAQLDKQTPDGICVDADGAVWVASPGTRDVIRVRDGGEITDRIPLEGRRAFACMLGGGDRRTLFLCTARRSFRNPALPPQGWIECVRVTVPGAGFP